VHQEIERHRAGALKKPGILFVPQRRGSQFDAELMTVSRTFMLDAGETEALALMRENPDALFLTDDSSARLVAEQMGFKVHGTIGIIVRSIRRGHRKPGEVLYALKEIPRRSTLYIKQSLLDEIVLKIKSEFNL
jgi:predicted nucleic acid-binding protein